jgi:hypothetical protein
MIQRRHRNSAWALSTLLALANAACSGDDGPDPNALIDEATNCGSLDTEPCDIIDTACQERLAEIAACQWGGPGTPPLLPTVTTLTEAEYREFLTASANAAAETTATAAMGTDMMPDDARTTFDDVLVEFGLIDGGTLSIEASIDRNADVVAAFYDFNTKSITIIDREQEVDLLAADSTLLHELIHAQQDAAHDLGGLLDSVTPTTDAFTSVSTLYEGEAQFHQTLFEAGMMKINLNAELLELGLRDFRQAAQNDLFMRPGALLSTLQYVPYIYGPEWMYDLWIQGGAALIQSQYDDVPTNLLGVLAAAWSKRAPDALLTTFPAANIFYRGTPPAEGSEVIPLAADRMGAWTVYVAARLAGEESLAQELALGWRGDQIDVFQLDAGGSAGRWRLYFDTAAHAAAFEQLLAENPRVTTRRSDKIVVGVVSQSGVLPEWLFGPL